MRYITLIREEKIDETGHSLGFWTKMPEGVSEEDVKETFISGDDLIGEYVGSMSESVLPTWSGTRPIPEGYFRRFTPKQLYDSFTSTEAIKALKSSNPDVKAQAELLAMNRDKAISVEDSGYKTAINDLEAEGILSSEIAAAYRKGIPMSRLEG